MQKMYFFAGDRAMFDSSRNNVEITRTEMNVAIP